MCKSFVVSLLFLLGSGEVRDFSFPKIPQCLVLAVRWRAPTLAQALQGLSRWDQSLLCWV